jgi:DNA-binding NtrC family response regulator
LPYHPMIRPHILIVETDHVLMNMLARSVRQHGYQVSMASVAAEGRAIIESGKIDMVVLEYLSSNRRHVDLFACVVAKEVPTILMSGTFKMPPQLQKMQHSVLTKPFSTTMLLKIIDEVFVPSISGQRQTD